ncbi:hypothetical protein CRENBAI_015412 [Crenichthys baileyi]|uniref:Uncharacterized protein n=1 Tax=Crenichthys baileyi TaxID=28760 RepID=A0AAV9SIB1_9TELE
MLNEGVHQQKPPSYRQLSPSHIQQKKHMTASAPPTCTDTRNRNTPIPQLADLSAQRRMEKKQQGQPAVAHPHATLAPPLKYYQQPIGPRVPQRGTIPLLEEGLKSDRQS